jgi:hypothetical protein
MFINRLKAFSHAYNPQKFSNTFNPTAPDFSG